VIGAVVGLVVVLLVVAAVAVARRAKHPDQLADEHPPPVDATDARFYSLVERPAGPDAEDPVGPDDPRNPGSDTQPPPG